MSDQRTPMHMEDIRKTSGFFAADVMSQTEHHTALQFALVAQQYSAEVGFDFESISLAMEKVHEEIKELDEAFQARDANSQHFAEELGDCFFALVNLCRHSGLNPETLLKLNTNKYLVRCSHVEDQLRAKGQSWQDTPRQEIHTMWRRAKVQSSSLPATRNES